MSRNTNLYFTAPDDALNSVQLLSPHKDNRTLLVDEDRKDEQTLIRTEYEEPTPLQVELRSVLSWHQMFYCLLITGNEPLTEVQYGIVEASIRTTNIYILLPTYRKFCTNILSQLVKN